MAVDYIVICSKPNRGPNFLHFVDTVLQKPRSCLLNRTQPHITPAIVRSGANISQRPYNYCQDLQTHWAGFLAYNMSPVSLNFTQLAPKCAVLCEITRHDDHSRSFKVTRGHRKLIFDFLLTSINFIAISHRFQVIAASVQCVLQRKVVSTIFHKMLGGISLN